MEKDIVVNLIRGAGSDAVKYIENGVEKERDGLCKTISSEYLQGQFRDLVAYMCDCEGDELNQPYTESERSLANTIIQIASSEDVVLRPYVKTGYDDSTTIRLDEIVSNHCPRIISKKTHSVDNVVETVNYIGLKIESNHIGGYED